MHRLLIGTCALALLLAAGIRADDEKKEEKKKEQKPAEVYKAVMQEAIKEYRAASSEEDRQKVLKACAGKLLDLAEKNPKDPVASQALVTLITGLPLPESKDGPKAKAIALLKQDHVKSKAIGNHLKQLVSGGDEGGLAVVKAVIEQNEDKGVKAKACEALVGHLENSLGMAYWVKHDSEIRPEFEKAYGKAKVKKMIADIPAQEKDLTEALKTLRTEFKGELKKDLHVGAPMPELTSEDLDGKKVKLSDLKGKVVVLDLWATWCPPCRAMIPHERKLVGRLKDKPFALVSVSFDEKKETLTKFLESNKMPWTHWWNGQTGMINKELGISSFPTIYVLDSKGVIRYKGVRGGAMDWAVEKLLDEMGDGKKSKTE
jgi:thiol-disulfide isomerase/thioredoxin